MKLTVTIMSSCYYDHETDDVVVQYPPQDAPDAEIYDRGIEMSLRLSL